MSRTTLGKARRADKDEFYTRYDDIKFELDHYFDQLKVKLFTVHVIVRIVTLLNILKNLSIMESLSR